MLLKHLFNTLPLNFTNLFQLGLGGIRKEGNSLFHLVNGSTTIDLPFKNNFDIMRGIPHLSAPVGKFAEMFSNVRFYICSTEDEEEIITDHKLNSVLARPNNFQTWKKMLYMNAVYKLIGGVSFIYPGFGVARTPSRLEFLTTLDYQSYIKNFLTTSYNVVNGDVTKVIRDIQFFFEFGSALTYKPDQLLWFKDSNVSYVNDYSRVTTLIKNIENIYKALVARGILIDKKGGIGMISGNQKDSGISVPLNPDEKKAIIERVNKYGLGIDKDPIIVTDVPLKYTPFVFPTRELMLFEEIQDDFFTICDTYGMSRELFANNTTFTNKEMAEASTYQNTILPAWEDFFELLNMGLNTAAENIKIMPDFSHIKAMQENEKDIVAIDAQKSSVHLQELDRNIITIDEYRQRMGYA